MDFSKLEDGINYIIRVNCICDGEWLDEVSRPFTATFHRRIASFEDANGNISQSPLEWFEDVKDHSHYSSSVISVKQTKMNLRNKTEPTT